MALKTLGSNADMIKIIVLLLGTVKYLLIIVIFLEMLSVKVPINNFFVQKSKIYNFFAQKCTQLLYTKMLEIVTY